MLNTHEIRELSSLNNTKSAIWIIFTWLLIAVTFAVPIVWPHPVVFFLAIVLMARHQMSLAVFMHDAAHKRIFTSVMWSDFFGQILFAGPIFFSMHSYRVFHLKHHKEPLVADDPDINLIGGYPISKASFRRKLIRDFFGFTYLKLTQYFISQSRTNQARRKQADGTKSGLSFAASVFFALLVNALLFAFTAVFGHWWYYFLLWILPIFTILQLILRIRGITEHAGYQPNNDQRLNARTVINPLQTFFFAPNNVNYHIEHHVYVSIPWYNLKKVHRLMKERNSLPEKNIFTGYGAVIKELVY